WLTHTPSDALSSDGVVVAGTVTDAQGRFRFSDVSVPSARHLRVTYVPPANVAYLDPVIGPGAGTLVPAVIRPTWVSYAPCPEECTYAAVDFRIRIFGPVEITEAPASVPGVVVIRTNPFMVTRPSVITVRGSNFRAGMKLYFKGSG